jgi:pSer/pThr/pTyr-binding forkhead associated (FHA) protein
MPDLILEIVEGKGGGRQVTLSGAVEIGRDSSTTLPLDDKQVSRHHARILEQGGVAVVEDLGSTNGTHVNEHPVEGPRELRPGDRVRVGTTVIELRTAQDVATRRSAVMPVPDVTKAGREVLEPMPEQELAAVESPKRDARRQEPAAPALTAAAPSFAVAESTPGFVPHEVLNDPHARANYAAVARLVDSRVKQRTNIAVFALLAAAGLAVLFAYHVL